MEDNTKECVVQSEMDNSGARQNENISKNLDNVSQYGNNNNDSINEKKCSSLPTSQTSKSTENYAWWNRYSSKNSSVIPHYYLPHSDESPICEGSPQRNSFRRHSLSCDDDGACDVSVANVTSSKHDKRFKRDNWRAASVYMPFTSENCSAIKSDCSHCSSTHILEQEGGKTHSKCLPTSHICEQSINQLNAVGMPGQQKSQEKDKSFIRKSSLNRIDFVNAAYPDKETLLSKYHTATACSPKESDTSDDNSDHQCISSCKGKHHNQIKELHKHSVHGMSSNNQVLCSKENESKLEVKLSDSEARKNSMKIRNKKVRPVKKAHSADEQNICADGSCTRYRRCMSAQDGTVQQECKELLLLKPSNRSRLLKQAAIISLNSDSQYSYEGTLTSNIPNETAHQNTCDTSSLETCKALSNQNNYSINNQLHHEHFTETNAIACESSICTNIFCLVGNKQKLTEDEKAFRDYSCSPNKVSCLFPLDCSEKSNQTCASSVDGDIEPNTDSRKADPYYELDLLEVQKEMAHLEVSGDTSTDDLSHIEMECNLPKQPSSILRRKQFGERREIQGILKHVYDDRISKSRPSILKHRESSEEKDNLSQGDLHSILKKSTSEEDSCNGTPDIRPILKNTSTDDESPSSSSKPKPILKKRTSFNEECSYACFSAGELKPILKKKTLCETPDDQPKPILKTRRKSEEVAKITPDFYIGDTRPRAYSADRGIFINSEIKNNDSERK